MYIITELNNVHNSAYKFYLNLCVDFCVFFAFSILRNRVRLLTREKTYGARRLFIELFMLNRLKWNGGAIESHIQFQINWNNILLLWLSIFQRMNTQNMMVDLSRINNKSGELKWSNRSHFWWFVVQTLLWFIWWSISYNVFIFIFILLLLIKTGWTNLIRTF